jgi:SAM-dependent methyltransferase
LAGLLRRFLEHPLTAGLDLDDPATTELRKEIIAHKPFLRAIYDEWYKQLSEAVPDGDGSVLELGSGAGYCERFLPNLITSDLIPCKGVQIVADAQRLPFADHSLKGIVFVNVLHHLPAVDEFFREAGRCLRPGGRIAMVEPWASPWSIFVHRKLHHEPFDPEAPQWSFPAGGPLSSANGALPWIVFERDKDLFQKRHSELSVERIEPFMPFRYIVSGGVSMRNLMPGFSHAIWRGIEGVLTPFRRQLGMFAFIVIRRV